MESQYTSSRTAESHRGENERIRGWGEIRMNEGCLSGHYWAGTSVCSLCGERLRCPCGAYVREDNLEKHLSSCKRIEQLAPKQEETNE